MRVLFLASRELTGPMTGRKQALRTVLESLAANDCQIVLAAFGADREEHLQALARWNVVDVIPLRRPGLLAIAWNLLWRFIFQGMTANECLFYSSGNLRILRDHLQAGPIDLVVCDMLRLAPYAAQLGKPWHLDLDDLLSQRYRNLAAGNQANDQLLGFYDSMLPGFVRRFAGWLARRCLPLEVTRMARREEQWSRAAASVSLVAPHEAAAFSRRLGIPVLCLPMRAQFPPPGFQSPPSTAGMVFLGGLDYQPNLDALRYYRQQVWPVLCELGLGDIPLHVLGKAPDATRQEFADCPGIVLHGYVDDLSQELCRYRLFLAPITHGTGIKTKVLDALGHGLPLVTTSKGIEGIGVQHELHCLVADTPAAIAQAIRRLWNEPALATQLARRGQQHVREHFSGEVLRNRWRDVLRPYFSEGRSIATTRWSAIVTEPDRKPPLSNSSA
jgi:hypothetical protein